ncbi:helix-turn-helix transcriptional regulator [Enterococcus gallinarum]|uniref:helix-turn-helix transcriptional regulator n=1 Tax=Enterococcus gallinarum TaxID=1353 RepID=UPI0012AB629E|nr:helix-turn-helix domain-containing protein [Enterococcus gallinarum]
MSKNNNKSNSSELEKYFFHPEKIEDSNNKMKRINQLPLVLTNKDLKEQFQISDSTLNRLIKLGDFPSCWFGIRGHYLRDDILEWVKKGNEEYFCDQFRLLRLL